MNSRLYECIGELNRENPGIPLYKIIIQIGTTTQRFASQCIEEEEMYAAAVSHLDCWQFDQCLEAFNKITGTPSTNQLKAR